jgi:site-specific DNA-methyltransferase (adenine-specific)
VRAAGEPSITEILSADKEFGWTSNFDGFRQTPKKDDVALYYFRGGKRLVGGIARDEVSKSPHLIDKWKVMIPKAYGERGARPAMVLGPCFIAESPSVCTQTYLFSHVSSKKQAESVQSYLNTTLLPLFGLTPENYSGRCTFDLHLGPTTGVGSHLDG